MRSNIDAHLLAKMHMQEACREQHEMCMFLCHQVSVHKQSLPVNSMLTSWIMFECGNIRNSTFEQSVYFCILRDGLQTSISFHPLTLANSEDPDEMQHNADFIWVCTDC